MSQDKQVFLEKYQHKQSQLVWKSLPADLETPISCYLKLAHHKKNAFLYESVEKAANKGRYSIIGFDPDLIWSCKNNEVTIKTEFNTKIEYDVLESFRRLMAETKLSIPKHLPSAIAGIYGYMGYDMIRHFEKLPSSPPDTIGIDDAIFIRPQIIIVFDNVYDVLHIASPVWFDENIEAEKAYQNAQKRLEDTLILLQNAIIPIEQKEFYSEEAHFTEPKYSITKDDFANMVRKAQDYIYDGDIFQVVPSQRFTLKFEKEPFNFYRVLRRINPSPYMFYLQFEDFNLIGSSPEILVRVQNNKVHIRPIAGTRPRGKTFEEDAQNAIDLMQDEKELAEHLMLLDLGRNDVGRVSKIGTVKVVEEFTIEHYSHVMHIVSHVEGELDAKYDALTAFLSGLPAGTVSGAPKIRAMEIINELEKEKRCFYAGGVGYFSASGDMDTAIMLRTCIIKDGELITQSGGGIVADSKIDDEYYETLHKAGAIFKAAAHVK